MTVTPVMKYHSPRYPDKQTALKDPLLLKNLPRRWAGRAAVVTAVTATTALMLTGCAVGEESSDAVSITSASAETNPASTLSASGAISSVAAAASSKPVSVVSTEPGFVNDKIAPLFIHGEGLGTYGCMSIAPAVFLSEEEAIAIIKDALNAEGVTLTEQKIEIALPLPLINIYVDPYTVSYKNGTLELDGVDKKKKIAFEFISDRDIGNYAVLNPGSPRPFKDAAQAIRGKLSETPTDYVVATFYDPQSANDKVEAAINEYMTTESYTEADDVKLRAILRTEIEKDLRLQVADFIAWLKAEDII